MGEGLAHATRGSSEWEGTVSHATRGRDGRQEGCESGYYHLRQHLNNLTLFHNHLSLLMFHIEFAHVRHCLSKLSTALA